MRIVFCAKPSTSNAIEIVSTTIMTLIGIAQNRGRRQVGIDCGKQGSARKEPRGEHSQERYE